MESCATDSYLLSIDKATYKDGYASVMVTLSSFWDVEFSYASEKGLGVLNQLSMGTNIQCQIQCIFLRNTNHN